MEHGFAIILKRARHIVGYTQTREMAIESLKAVDPRFRGNYEIVPHIHRVVANEN